MLVYMHVRITNTASCTTNERGIRRDNDKLAKGRT